MDLLQRQVAGRPRGRTRGAGIPAHPGWHRDAGASLRPAEEPRLSRPACDIRGTFDASFRRGLDLSRAKPVTVSCPAFSELWTSEPGSAFLGCSFARR